jgi:tetratricopeptide (TPR) repeat protein
MRNILFIFAVIVGLSLNSCSESKEEKSFKIMNQAIELYHSGHTAKALEMFDEAVRLDENNKEAYYFKATNIVQKGKYEEGIDYLDQLTEKFPEYGKLYKLRAEAKSIIKDKAGACEDWKIADSLGIENLSDRLRHCK